MPQASEEGRIMVLLDAETFKKLEEYAKQNSLPRYGDAVRHLLEKEQ